MTKNIATRVKKEIIRAQNNFLHPYKFIIKYYTKLKNNIAKFFIQTKIYYGGGGVICSSFNKIKQIIESNLDSKFEFKYDLLTKSFIESSKDSKLYTKKILKNLNAVTSWINSNEFKKEYANSPYPPIFNPKNIDYTRLPAAFCDALNLPLVPHYNFIFFVFGASAHGTIVSFLEKILDIKIDLEHCNISKNNTIKPFMPYPSEHKDIFVYYRWFMPYEIYDYKFPVLSCKMPFLILVRDPISRLKTMVNHGFANTNIIDFNLHDDVKKVFDRKRFHGAVNENGEWLIDKMPNIKSLEYFVRISPCMNFAYSSIANICKNNVFYMDMAEFLPQNVMDSIRKYAKFFNKTLDENKLQQNKAYLQEKKWTNLSNVIPLNMKILANNRILTLHINLKNEIPKNMIEISDLIFDKDYEILKIVSFSMNNYDLCILRNNEIAFIDVKIYMQKFIDELIKIDKKILDSQVKENDILQYFLNNKKIYDSFKSLLDVELAHIKKHRPDIIESWKFYNEFEKLF